MQRQYLRKHRAWIYTGAIIAALSACLALTFMNAPSESDASASAPRDYDAIAREGVLRVTTEYNSVSFYVDGDTISGFNYELVEAFIEVKVTPQKGFGYDRVAEEIARHKEVRSLYLMSGAYDFAVIIEGRSLRSISRFVSERISTFECVLSTATHFILKKYKIEGALTANADEERRLSVQP